MTNRRKKYINLVIIVALISSTMKIVDNYEAIFDGIWNFINVLTPFIYAFLIAYILNPIMSFLEKKFKLKRFVSITITYAFILCVVFFLLVYLVPKAGSSLYDLIQNIPDFARITQDKISKLTTQTKILNRARGDIIKYINNYIPQITGFLNSTLNTFLSRAVSITINLVNILFGLIISIYVLYDKEKFIYNTRKFIYIVFRKKIGRQIIEFFSTMHSMIGTSIGAKALDSLIIAVIAFIGVTVLGSSYTLLIAIIVGVTNMIPYIGPTVGILIAFIVNIFFSSTTAVKIALFLWILQQFDCWFLDPKLVGNKVGLSPFLAILAITIGGSYFGIIGMILSIPIVAVMKIYFHKFIKKYRIYRKEKISSIE